MTLYRSLGLSIVMTLGLLLGACSRGNEDASVGQRVDAAMERASDAAHRMGSNAREIAREAKPASPGASGASRPAAANASEPASSASMGSDTRITATVKMGLSADKDLSASSIDVDTQAGVVTLKGNAPTATAKARAGEIARNVRDVKSVDNQLVVPPG